MPKYSFSFKPLKPYVFFGESTFGNDDNQYYLQESRLMPQQTTVMGAVLELLLKNQNLFKENYKYEPEQLEQINDIFGGLYKNQLDEQTPWGKINGLSPVTIVKNNEYLIPNNYKIKDNSYKYAFDSTEITGSTISTAVQDVSPKDYTEGFINLNTQKLVDAKDVYYESTTHHVNLMYGDAENKKTFYKKTNPGDEGNYYAVKKYMLNDDYKFQVELDIDLELVEQSTFVRMGSKASAFEVEIIKISDSLYTQQFNTFMKNNVSNLIADTNFEFISNPTIIDLSIDALVIGEKQSLRHYLKSNETGKRYVGGKKLVQTFMPGSFICYDKQNSEKKLLNNGIVLIKKRSEDEKI